MNLYIYIHSNQAVISGGAGGFKTAKTALAQMPVWCLCLQSRGKLEFYAILNIPSCQRESQGESSCCPPQGLPGVLSPLENAPRHCRDGILMERRTFSTRPGCSKLYPACLGFFSVPKFLFLLPCCLLSLSLVAWSLMGKLEKLIRDIHVSPTNTVAEKRARTPWNMKGLFLLPRHTLNQGCWGWEEV